MELDSRLGFMLGPGKTKGSKMGNFLSVCTVCWEGRHTAECHMVCRMLEQEYVCDQSSIEKRELGPERLGQESCRTARG